MPVVPASGSASDMRNLSLSEVEMHATALSGPEGVVAQDRPCHVHPRHWSPPITSGGCRYHRPVFGCLFFALVRRCRLLERCSPSILAPRVMTQLLHSPDHGAWKIGHVQPSSSRGYDGELTLDKLSAANFGSLRFRASA